MYLSEHTHNTIKSSRVKDPFRAQERPMDFNVIKNEKFTDKLSGYTLQLAFEKLPLVEFWCSIKEEYPQLPEKDVKIHLCTATDVN